MLWCQDGRFIGPESKEIDLKGYFKPVKFKPIKFTPTECVFLNGYPTKISFCSKNINILWKTCTFGLTLLDLLLQRYQKK